MTQKGIMMKKSCSRSMTLATFDRTRDPASGKMYEVRVVACEYAGYWHVDLRLYFLQEDDSWMPTKKGVVIRASEIDEVFAALEEAKKLIGNPDGIPAVTAPATEVATFGGNAEFARKSR